MWNPMKSHEIPWNPNPMELPRMAYHPQVLPFTIACTTEEGGRVEAAACRDEFSSRSRTGPPGQPTKIGF